jgi:hypothetical protein
MWFEDARKKKFLFELGHWWKTKRTRLRTGRKRLDLFDNPVGYLTNLFLRESCLEI